MSMDRPIFDNKLALTEEELSIETAHLGAVFAWHETLANGGGTFDAATLEAVYPTRGYAVGVDTNGGTQADGPHTLAWAVRVIRTARPDIAYIGTWVREPGTVIVDPVVLVDNQADALALAKRHAQEAIFDFAAAESITVDGGRR